jgi:glycerol-3-phosphate dehydrogenase
MKKIETEIVVIGGGATGTGLVRDFAMRGFNTLLVEKGDLASGTTGRFHGLLHSGGRYVVKDPQAAKECIDENYILRKIMPFCIEDTGGLFVLTPWDDPDYVPQFIKGCALAKIPCKEENLKPIFSEEPLLNKNIIRAFRLPDASVDSFIAAEANAMSGKEYGALVLPYHPVSKLILSGNRIQGVLCRDLFHDEEIEISADLVVNAAGAWVSSLLSPVGITVKMVLGKGSMLAFNHRIVNKVINRCKMPADGDILVPSHTVAVLGTTDFPVFSQDHLTIESWEVDLMIKECEKIIPGASKMRILRAWAGVRPLLQDDQKSNNREISRAFVLLDHLDRDGIEGLVTITSGKWTTYRKMAEKTADLVCYKLKTQRKCRTQAELLPDPENKMRNKNFYFLGSRLNRIETEKEHGKIICECELVTYSDIVDAFTQRQAITLGDLRRDTRLGMGPCQGCFCTLRAAGIGHTVKNQPIHTANQTILDYINERWNGIKPILWGIQLKQEYLNLFVYKNLLCLQRLNFPQSIQSESLEVSKVQKPEDSKGVDSQDNMFVNNGERLSKKNNNHSFRRHLEYDVAVIGMGFSGLITAWRMAKRGLRVGILSKGMGALNFNTGCVDILGSHQGKQVSSPIEAIKTFPDENPDHPYARFTHDDFTGYLSELSKLCATAEYSLEGVVENNWLLPTALGALRPTCLAPSTMVGGDLHSTQPILVIGIKDFFDFYPKSIAQNLCAQGIYSDFSEIEIKGRWKSRIISGRRLADLFEEDHFRNDMIGWIEDILRVKKPFNPQRIAFPAVLGIKSSQEVVNQLQKSLGIPIFEIPTLPPSIPGLRLQEILKHNIKMYGGAVLNGSYVVSEGHSHHRINEVYVEAAAGLVSVRAKEFILASGGILGGGIVKQYKTPIEETIFGLPVATRQSLISRGNHSTLLMEAIPYTTCGIKTNQSFQPVNEMGSIIYENLYCIGLNLFGVDYIEELSADGVALMSGFRVGEHIL